MSKQPLDIQLPKLWDDLSLRSYLGEIRRRHGIVETLALPSMHDLPPLRIETIYVAPLLAETPVSSDSDPKLWPEGKSLLETLEEHPQLVVLGDPGGGKTTLSNWLAWRLSAGLTSPLPSVLEDRVPLPCVLREMPATIFSPEFTLADLAVSIADRLLGNKADESLKENLRARVEAGSYVLILDGVDEIQVNHRKLVANWMQQAYQQKACVLATSRIVGYEDFSVHRKVIRLNLTKSSDIHKIEKGLPIGKFADEANRLVGNVSVPIEIGMAAPLVSYPEMPLPGRDAWPVDFSGESWSESISKMTHLSSLSWIDVPFPDKLTTWAQLRYLMPFDQSRIVAFVENWYRQRCGSDHEAQQKASDLLASLAQSDVTRQLARTPNLLGLMAIVHRERAHLPDGKALLYDEIANAYINTIDKQRKIEPGDALAPYEWKARRAWLAYVGFQMQLRRSEQLEKDEKSDDGVLASEEEVLSWLTYAMRLSEVAKPEETSLLFLKWVARRSGLLLPRGDKRYAFVHLSFQEYFCAHYLYGRIVSPAFIHNKLPEDAPVTKPKLAAWSWSPVWRETLVYLFELLSAEQGMEWVEELAGMVFPEQENTFDLMDHQAALAGRLLTDRHIRLGEAWRDKLVGRCIWQAKYDWEIGQFDETSISVLPALRDAGYAAIVGAKPLNSRTSERAPIVPDCLSLDDISANQPLRICIVVDESVSDIAPLSGFTNLQMLDLSNTKVSDVMPLSGLENLRVLDLGSTQVSDVTSLSGLRNLSSLTLGNTQLVDMTPLSGLVNLQELILGKTQVEDLASLSGLVNLQSLFLSSTGVKDITPLSGLVNLQTLFLSGTGVKDITPLSGLVNLQTLFLSDTPVEDVVPLSGLINLWTLFLGNTQVEDVAPLSGLINLRTLFLNNTQVDDVAPLSGLTNLLLLSLSNTKVSDVVPLSGLVNMKSLSLDKTRVTDVSALSGLENLTIHGLASESKKKRAQRKEGTVSRSKKRAVKKT